MEAKADITHITKSKGRSYCGKLTAKTEYSLDKTNCKKCFEDFKAYNPNSFKAWKEKIDESTKQD